MINEGLAGKDSQYIKSWKQMRHAANLANLFDWSKEKASLPPLRAVYRKGKVANYVFEDVIGRSVAESCCLVANGAPWPFEGFFSRVEQVLHENQKFDS